jgi:hypothetical protein
MGERDVSTLHMQQPFCRVFRSSTSQLFMSQRRSDRPWSAVARFCDGLLAQVLHVCLFAAADSASDVGACLWVGVAAVCVLSPAILTYVLCESLPAFPCYVLHSDSTCLRGCLLHGFAALRITGSRQRLNAPPMYGAHKSWRREVCADLLSSLMSTRAYACAEL